MPLTSLDAKAGARESAADLVVAACALQSPTASALEKVNLDRAIAQLPPGYQAIFLLHDTEGYRHDEIAKILSISEGTSKSQLHKARLRLRTLVGNRSNGRAGFRPAPEARRRKRQPSPCAAQYAMA